jgi:hypothetical protein
VLTQEHDDEFNAFEFLKDFYLDSLKSSNTIFFGNTHDHLFEEKTDFFQTQFTHGWRCFVFRAVCVGATLAQSLAGICRDV